MVWQCQFVDWSIWLSSDFYSTWKDFVGQHWFTSDQPSASQGWLKTRQLLAYLEIISNICWKTQFFHIDQYSVPLFEAVIIWISQRHQSFKKLEQWPYENVKQVLRQYNHCFTMPPHDRRTEEGLTEILYQYHLSLYWHTRTNRTAEATKQQILNCW